MLLLFFKATVVESTATISGSSTVTGVASAVATASTVITGSSTVSPIDHAIHEVTSTIQGESLVSVTTQSVHSTTASINGLGSVSVVTQYLVSTTCTITGDTSLAPLVCYVIPSECTISGGSTTYVECTSVGGVTDTQATITGSSTLTVVSERVAPAQQGTGSSGWIGKRPGKYTPPVYKGKLPDWDNEPLVRVIESSASMRGQSRLRVSAGRGLSAIFPTGKRIETPYFPQEPPAKGPRIDPNTFGRGKSGQTSPNRLEALETILGIRSKREVEDEAIVLNMITGIDFQVLLDEV